jgi:hypothetical protein
MYRLKGLSGYRLVRWLGILAFPIPALTIVLALAVDRNSRKSLSGGPLEAVTRLWHWLWLPTHQNSLNGRLSPIDLAIPITEKDFHKLRFVIDSIVSSSKNEIKNIFLIVPQAHATSLSDIDLREDIPVKHVYDEELISKEGLHKLKRKFGKNANWVKQQVLKVTFAASPQVQNPVLVADADTVILGKVAFLIDDVQTLFMRATRYAGYDDASKSLGIDALERFPSNVCHQMLYQKDLVNEYIDRIRAETGKDLVDSVCSSVSTSHSPLHCAVDYETYGDFVRTQHRKRVRPTKWTNDVRSEGSMAFPITSFRSCLTVSFHHYTQ